jgi:hypothetical protein
MWVHCSGCCLGYVAAAFRFCVPDSGGGVVPQVGGEGGTVGVPGVSPPSWVSPCVFLLPVVVRHTSHPSFEGRRAMVVGLLFGTLGGCSTTGN